MTQRFDPHLMQLLEEVGNVRHVCPEHAVKPGGFIGRDPASFIGRDVKLCFPTLAGGSEAMWVHVDRVEGAELYGTLRNEPTERLAPFLGDLHFGDALAFAVEEIAGLAPSPEN